MKKADPILGILEGGPLNGVELARRLGVTRQAVNKRLRQLVLSGQVVRSGVTRGATYFLAGRGSAPPGGGWSFKWRLSLAGLAEDLVFDRIERERQLKRMLPENVAAILRYAFTEMLNNAIDHSASAHVHVAMALDPYECFFSIRDYGVGIFQSIARKFQLVDETRAVEELLKGKVTTMAERHSGEGIFFTTKVGDVVTVRSHGCELTCDNSRADVILRDCRRLKGTEVSFRLARHSRRQLQAVFREYAPEYRDYRFDKTRIHIRLYQGDYVSRSEGRRLVVGLDKFSEAVLDFEGVNAIGQGFADEVFRVYSAMHPALIFEIVNASPAVETMIRHAVDKSRLRQVDNRLTITSPTG